MKTSLAYKLGTIPGNILNFMDNKVLPRYRSFVYHKDCSLKGLFLRTIDAYKNRSIIQLRENLDLLKSWYPDYPETVEAEKLYLQLEEDEKKEILQRQLEEEERKKKEMLQRQFEGLLEMRWFEAQNDNNTRTVNWALSGLKKEEVENYFIFKNPWVERSVCRDYLLSLSIKIPAQLIDDASKQLRDDKVALKLQTLLQEVGPSLREMGKMQLEKFLLEKTSDEEAIKCLEILLFYWPISIVVFFPMKSIISTEQLYDIISQIHFEVNHYVFSLDCSEAFLKEIYMNGHSYIRIEMDAPIDLLKFLNYAVVYDTIQIWPDDHYEDRRTLSSLEIKGLKTILKAGVPLFKVLPWIEGLNNSYRDYQ